MNIRQLRDFLSLALDAGVEPTLPVCVHRNDPVEAVMEISDANLVHGPYLEDPAPKMSAFRPESGTFLLLATCVDYDPLWNGPELEHRMLLLDVEVPVKE
jgi:hypothetical protein